jgi:hypothetical protein
MDETWPSAGRLFDARPASFVAGGDESIIYMCLSGPKAAHPVAGSLLLPLPSLLPFA